MPNLLLGTDAAVAACADLWIRALTARDGVAPPDGMAARIVAKLRHPALRFVVVDEQAQPAAFALTTRLSESSETSGYRERADAETVGYLELLAVAPETTQRGLGTALLTDALESAAAAGCETAMLHVRIDNSRAIGLYERFGFETVGEPSPHELSGALMVEMSRTLVPA